MSANRGMVAGSHNRNEFFTIRRDGDAPAPVEKAKHDDALSDLSDILTDLKGMAIDMGCETSQQTSDLGHAEKGFDELNFRVKGGNTRTRHLLGR